MFCVRMGTEVTGATLARPPVRHQEDTLMLGQSPTFGDPRLPARFWAKVNENGPVPAHRPDLGPCWEWTGTRNRNGYGKFWDGSKKAWVHRWAFEALIGPIPDGLECDHLCHNGAGCLGGPSCPHRTCVNPAHIEPVTHAVNDQRGVRVRMTGEASGRAKLREADIPVIRALRGKMQQRDLAAWYGVHHSTIYAIHCGKTWTHI